MLKEGVTCLPVLQGDKVLGLLTVKNILAKIAGLKVRKNFDIRYIGLSKLDLEPHQKYSLQTIANNEALKIQRAWIIKLLNKCN